MIIPGKNMNSKENHGQDNSYENHRHLMNVRSLTFFNNRDFLQRSFQIELYEVCKSRDTVVCLRSGYAKQFFTVMLVKFYSHNDKSILFVGKHLNSIKMYAGLLRSHTDLNIDEVYDCDQFQKLSQTDVCFVDEQTCMELMKRNSTLRPVNLVIFDQVHQVVCSKQKTDPYSEIAKYFRVNYKARILGLSASIITEGVKSFVFAEIIQQIEQRMGCVCETYADLKMINKYSINARIQLRFYRPITIQTRYERLEATFKNFITLEKLKFLHKELQETCEYFVQVILIPMLSPEDESLKLVTLEMLAEMMNSFFDVYTHMGEWCALKLINSYLRELDDIVLFLTDSKSEYLQRIIFAMSTLRSLKNKILVSLPKNIRTKFLSNRDNNNDSKHMLSLNEFMALSCERLHILAKSFNDYFSFSFNDNICAIIYANSTARVRCLVSWITELAAIMNRSHSGNSFAHLKPDCVFLKPEESIEKSKSNIYYYNQHQKSMHEIHYYRRQEEALKKFRFGHGCNVLCTTSMNIDGMDVFRCSFVYCFDAPDSLQNYIRAKGRMRLENGRFVIAAQEDSGYDKSLNEFLEIEHLFTKLMPVHHTVEIISSNSSQFSISQKSQKSNSNQQSLTVCSNIALTMDNSLSILNRYCTKLPSDIFTRLSPNYQLESLESDGMILYRCSLYLPINSVFRDKVVGDLMENKIMAKRSAAYKAVKILLNIGELDSNFYPYRKETTEYIQKLGLEDCFNSRNISSGGRGRGRGPRGNRQNRISARTQASKKRNIFQKCINNAFFGNCFIPIKNDLFRIGYLYEFSMKLTCHLFDAEIVGQKIGRGRVPIDPADSARNIAVLSAKPFPPLCNFTVYNRSGEIIVTVKRIEMKDLIDASQIKKLRTFHYYIFENALRFGTKLSFLQDSEKGVCGDIVVVPVLNSKIDWQFVEQIFHHYPNGGYGNPATFDSNGNFVFQQDAYEDAVVVPKYRREKRFGFFYVAQICHELTPRSHFPDGDYGTFENYYKIKYGLNITNKEQPLLDVDHTSSRLNLLIPRYLNRKGFKASHVLKYVVERTPQQNQQRQLLLPELCLIHPIPGSFWRKMEALPSILYRINSLLNAEKFRSMVALEAGIGVVNLPEGKKWPDLDFGWPKIIQRANEEEAQTREQKHINEIGNSKKNSTLKTLINTQKHDQQIKECSKNVVENVDNTKSTLISNNNDVQLDAFSQMDDWSSFEKTISSSDNNQNFGSELDLPLEILDFSEMFVPFLNSQNSQIFPNDIAEQSEDFSLNLTTLSRDISRMNFDQEVIEHLNQYYCQDEDFDPDDDDDDEFSTDYEDYSDDQYMSEHEESEDDDDDEDDEEVDFDSYEKNKHNKNDGMLFQNNWQNGVSCHRIRSFIYDYLKLEMLYDWKYYEKQLSQQVNLELANSETSPFLLGQFCSSDDIPAVNVFDAFHSIEQNDISRIIDNICQELQEKTGITCKFEPLNESKCFNLLEYIHQISIPGKNQYDDSKSIIKSAQNLFSEQESSSIKTDNEIKFGELLPNRNSSFESVPKLFCFDSCNDNCLGPDPSLILQAITMSNSADGINLERLETVGDSFLKYSITAFLFVMCPDLNEGKLSFLRSRQISNLNLHRLGQKINLGNLMITSKFDPNDNWCPPGYRIDESKLNLPSSDQNNKDTYNIFLEHSIRNKSIADCVEALIGTYLISSGTRAAIEFMNWLGLKVRPKGIIETFNGWLPKAPSALICNKQIVSQNLDEIKAKLDEFYHHWRLDEFEKIIGYKFNDRAFLVQAFTHNSYYENSITDCYQRLEFLGDAVLDYLITRYLYEDPKCHSPGALTDLRSALVNNTFFASLAVKYNFHKYLLSLSPELFRVVDGFVCKFQISTKQKSKDENQNNVFGYWELFVSENETEHLEDIEVPKALGDIFESVAGAIFLDSGMSLEAVWNAYYPMMKPEIDYFSYNVPKSPIRVLLEMHPHVAKFGKPEVTSGRKIRIVVNVNDVGQFIGIGRNKRIAKCTAAKRALRALKLVKAHREKNSL